jgi:hypothetical protein
MKIPEVRKLVETLSIEELEKAESALYDERQPEIEIGGVDEGEQLTQIIAAIWIKKDMAANGENMKASMRNYTQKVRNSIS